ncbi:hypothetical protein CK203_013631 [Vitis vinifera]|uniref:Uncharacterized protein n=1 Tax=Vitis vinifera TaxID=29760 RepID=A0A438J931_VITVI|nr:hypothetical protein CK203_013631 [Vitis vinifera]
MRVPCLVITGREKIDGEEEDSNTSSPGCCLHQLHMSTNKCPLSSSKIGLNKIITGSEDGTARIWGKT